MVCVCVCVWVGGWVGVDGWMDVWVGVCVCVGVGVCAYVVYYLRKPGMIADLLLVQRTGSLKTNTYM